MERRPRYQRLGIQPLAPTYVPRTTTKLQLPPLFNSTTGPDVPSFLESTSRTHRIESGHGIHHIILLYPSAIGRRVILRFAPGPGGVAMVLRPPHGDLYFSSLNLPPCRQTGPVFFFPFRTATRLNSHPIIHIRNQSHYSYLYPPGIEGSSWFYRSVSIISSLIHWSSEGKLE